MDFLKFSLFYKHVLNDVPIYPSGAPPPDSIPPSILAGQVAIEPDIARFIRTKAAEAVYTFLPRTRLSDNQVGA